MNAVKTITDQLIFFFLVALVLSVGFFSSEILKCEIRLESLVVVRMCFHQVPTSFLKRYSTLRKLHFYALSSVNCVLINSIRWLSRVTISSPN